MRNFAWSILASAILAAPAAAEPITFVVSANLQYGGTLTGTLTFDDDTKLTSLSSFDLVASAGPGSPGHAFPGFTYDLATSSVTAESSTLIQFDSAGSADELRLNFASALTDAGATLKTSSYESEVAGGNRTFLAGGTLVAVPEPASIALTASALAILLGLARARRGRSAS